MPDYVTRDELNARLAPLGDVVTRAELAASLSPLAEIRSLLAKDIDRLHQGQQTLFDKIDETRTAITDRQDVANHRTSKNEEAVSTIATIVASIKQHGCDEKKEHNLVIDTLRRSGAWLTPGAMIAETDEHDEHRAKTFLKKHKTKAIGGGLVGIGVLLPHIWEGIHQLIHWATNVPIGK